MTLEVAVEKTFKGFKLCVQFAHDNDIMAVSYTHLDVYKRQATSCG